MTIHSSRPPSFPSSRVAQATIVLLLLLSVALGHPRPAAARRPTQTASSTALWQQIDAYVEQERQAARIPGIALGIVQGEQVVHLQGFGIADPSGRAVTAETPFRVGSAAKSMTAVAILQLVEQGKVELDTPVQHVLPWFTLADPEAAARLTVRHLLTQSSGLARATGVEAATNRDDLQDGALERQVRAWHDAETTSPPGTTFQYNNANYVILGLLVETLSGQSFESYLEQHLFAPLEMRHARVGRADQVGAPVAMGYRYWLGVPRAADLNYGRVLNPAGGVVASAEEMTHYLVAQLGGGRYGDAQLLAPSSIAEAQRPAISMAGSSQAVGFDEVAYGLGWMVGTRNGVPVVSHPGDLPTYHAEMLLIPDEAVAIVLLMNSNNRFSGERMRAMADGVTALMLGHQPAPVETGSNLLVLIFRIVLGLALLQVGAIAWSLRGIRRWVREPLRPWGRWAVIRHLLAPLGFHLLLALAFLGGLPLLLNQPLWLITESTPDLGGVALVSGVIALVWGIGRTLFLVKLVARRERSKAVSGVVPA